MSTHYIEEAERLCDRVAIVSAGRIVVEGTPAALVAEHAGHHALEVFGPPDRLREVEAQAARAGLPTRRTGNAVAVLRTDGRDLDVGEAVRRPPTLEDVFVLLTGEELG
jgi:lipooligosaccharide transport system ATP-binding protein